MSTDDFKPNEHPHIRRNPLNGEWVLVSPHRTLRPWLGQIENVSEEEIPELDLNNPLCPGATRPNGEENPNYYSTYVFNNDFPALLESSPKPEESEDPFFQCRPANGVCRVLCFHPKSNITIPLMTEDEIVAVIDMWKKQQAELGRVWTWVQLFENRGAIMGCSNPHPHGQVWASNYLPTQPKIKDEYQMQYYKTYNRPLLLDYVKQELIKKERIVCENEDWVVLVPYWASWPFETMLLPKTHLKCITEITGNKLWNLAKIMKELTTRYDNLFNCSFPYSMGWHGAPSGEYKKNHETTHWVLHAMYYPPLLRSATIKKFMVGYELLAQAQRDLTPEQAAAKLRDLPKKHYKLARKTHP